MTRQFCAWLAVLTISSSSTLAVAAQKEENYIVGFRKGTSTSEALKTTKAAGLSQLQAIPELSVVLAKLPKNAKPSQVLKTLKDADTVEFLEKDEKIWKTFPVDVSGIRRYPNDPNTGAQWALDRIRANRAWDITTGSKNVVVAVVDTGIDMTHPELKSQIWHNTKEIAGNGIDDDKNGYKDDVNGWDFEGKDNDPSDDQGHGTHVAGIIGAEGDNGRGITGINWQVSLMPLKFLDSKGSGSLSGGALSIVYAATNGAQVINASWGGPSGSSTLKRAIEFASSRGVLFVAAAGNESALTDADRSYPSGYDVDNILSVAATAFVGGLAGFSNFGQVTVHLAAPGERILSTYPGEKLAYMSGTSMATPVVTGVAALILSANPDLTVTQLRNAILNATESRSVLAFRVSTGGEIDAGRAIEQLAGGFQIWPSRITLAQGQQFQFTAYSASQVTWSVEDPSIATVNSSGLVQAVKPGNTRLTGTQANGQVSTTESIQVVAGVAPDSTGCSSKKSPSTPASAGGMALSMGLPFVAAWFSTRKRKKTNLNGRDSNSSNS